MAGSAPGALRQAIAERQSAGALADAFLAKLDTKNATPEIQQAQIDAMKRHVWANPGAVLCIKNVPKKVTKVQLEAFFGQFGKVREMRLPVNRLDPKARAHRGMCMLTYEDPSVFFNVLVMAQTTPHVIEGEKVSTTVMTPSEIRMEGEKPMIQRVAVSPHQPPYMGFGTNTFRRVFLSKVTIDIDDREFHTYFSQFGDVEVTSRPHGGNLGVGFVTFKQVEPAMIVVAMRDHCIDGRWVVAGESQDGPGPAPGGMPGPPLKDKDEDDRKPSSNLNKALNDRSDRRTDSRALQDRRDRSRDRSRDRDRDRDRDKQGRSDPYRRSRPMENKMNSSGGESQIARESRQPSPGTIARQTKRRDVNTDGW